MYKNQKQAVNQTKEFHYSSFTVIYNKNDRTTINLLDLVIGFGINVNLREDEYFRFKITMNTE